MDEPSTIGPKPAGDYSISGSAFGIPRIAITLILTKTDGQSWAEGDRVECNDGDGRFGTFLATPGHLQATMTYMPGSVGDKLITAINNRGWDNPDPFRFTVLGAVANTIGAVISMGL